jgi:hypothetical protein
MFLKASRALQVYYVVVLTLTISAFGIGVKYFWDNGPFDVENLNAAFEASLHFDELKDKAGLDSVKILVEEDRARDAILRLNTVDKRTKTLHHFNKVESYENFRSSLNQTKKHLNELISYPQMGSVILVLANKVSSFESFVVQNNWRSLTRISRRVKARMSGRSIQTPGFFTKNKLETLLKLTQKDVELIKKITMGSVLSNRDKQNIVGKLKTVNTEVSMLSSYTSAFGNFSGSFKTLKRQYKTWFEEVAPQISLTKLKMEKDTQTMAFALLGIGAFLLFSLFGGIWFYSRTRRSEQAELEQKILKRIQDGLFPMENKIVDQNTSEDFKREFDRCREYFHKRISFGTVFQEAVPFSSVLLDSNLNVTWANDLFYEHWNLSETHREGSSVSWDFLQQYTNLGEDDPVLMAHNQGVAGIYQIQVKDPKTNDCLPYEMYVSPVEYSQQKRIMIFFYPLRSLEETITNQTKAIVGPIRRTLEAFSDNTFNQSTQEKLLKDYEVAGIGELFEKLKIFFDATELVKSEFLEEIQILENSINDQMKLVSDLEAFGNRELSIASDSKVYFEKTKTAIIHNIDLRYELERLFTVTLNISKDLLKQEHSLMESSVKSINIIEENQKAFVSVNATKEEFKDLKGTIDELRARLNQSLEQTLMFMKKEGIDPKLESSITKVRLEMKGVEQVLQSFNKVLRNLDVGLGKMALISEQAEMPRLDKMNEALVNVRKDIDDSTFEFGRLTRSGQKTDELVVESLKELYQGFSLSNELNESGLGIIYKNREEDDVKEVIFTEDQELSQELDSNL